MVVTTGMATATGITTRASIVEAIGGLTGGTAIAANPVDHARIRRATDAAHAVTAASFVTGLRIR